MKSSLKIGKAAGPGDIPAEVFKSCDFDDICLDFCSQALIKNDKPDLWSFMNKLLSLYQNLETCLDELLTACYIRLSTFH